MGFLLDLSVLKSIKAKGKEVHCISDKKHYKLNDNCPLYCYWLYYIVAGFNSH